MKLWTTIEREEPAHLVATRRARGTGVVRPYIKSRVQ